MRVTQATLSYSTVIHVFSFQVPVMVLIPTQKVEVVDTTGAGDALIGALAFYMSCYPQLSFAEMVFRAVNIATVTVMAHGVQASYPAAEQLDKWLFDNNARTSEQLVRTCITECC